MEVKQVEIDKLIPYARNPRRNDASVAKVAASLEEFGWRQPIVTDSEYVVIAGHTRLKAALTLGMTEVPVHIADLPAEKAKAYRIADNRIGMDSDFVDDLLALEIMELKGDDFDIGILGFGNEELDRILDQDESGPGEPDEDEQGDFTELTFILHAEQLETVKRAIEESKALGAFETDLNENRNGNALARICETFITTTQFHGGAA
jgi:hypothetical protein